MFTDGQAAGRRQMFPQDLTCRSLKLKRTMTMKKIIIVTAAFAALSAPAFAQSMNNSGTRSLHSLPDYAAIQAGEYGSPIGLKLLEAEQLYNQYND
jgi:hypothetical protein